MKYSTIKVDKQYKVIWFFNFSYIQFANHMCNAFYQLRNITHSDFGPAQMPLKNEYVEKRELNRNILDSNHVFRDFTHEDWTISLWAF